MYEVEVVTWVKVMRVVYGGGNVIGGTEEWGGSGGGGRWRRGALKESEAGFAFSPRFDELLNGTTPVASKSSAIHVVDAPNQRQQQNTTLSTSTTVAVDTPPLKIQTTPCMTRSSTNELFTPFKDLEREFRSSRRHFKTLSLDELRSHDLNLFSDQENSEEEEAKTMAETVEQYISKTRADYGSGVVRPKIEDKDNFELKGIYQGSSSIEQTHSVVPVPRKIRERTH
ncbi:hypothetical protein Tco_1484203 [Tanacetum coccineum]